MGGVVLLNIVLLIVAAALLARQARRRAELTEQLANENEELERRVRRRTTELSALSSHLQQLSEKEKASLARELHDELGGLLIAVKMDVSWLQKRWPSARIRISRRAGRACSRCSMTASTSSDASSRTCARRCSTTWGCCRRCAGSRRRPAAARDCTTPRSIRKHEPLLIDDAAIMVFRLVQESLTNIVKHAHASEVRVEIAVRTDELTVLIEDNGVGIDSDRRDAVGSHGLATMRHRVRSFGGTLDIESMSPRAARGCARGCR